MKALRSLTQMKALAPTAHWERRKGTHAQAKAYVTKEDEVDDHANMWMKHKENGECGPGCCEN